MATLAEPTQPSERTLPPPATVRPLSVDQWKPTNGPSMHQLRLGDTPGYCARGIERNQLERSLRRVNVLVQAQRRQRSDSYIEQNARRPDLAQLRSSGGEHAERPLDVDTLSPPYDLHGDSGAPHIGRIDDWSGAAAGSPYEIGAGLLPRCEADQWSEHLHLHELAAQLLPAKINTRGAAGPLRLHFDRRAAIGVRRGRVYLELMRERPRVVAERHPTGLAVQCDFTQQPFVLDAKHGRVVGPPLHVVGWTIQDAETPCETARRMYWDAHSAAWSNGSTPVAALELGDIPQSTAPADG
jgi:hypothetical protein